MWLGIPPLSSKFSTRVQPVSVSMSVVCCELKKLACEGCMLCERLSFSNLMFLFYSSVHTLSSYPTSRQVNGIVEQVPGSLLTKHGVLGIQEIDLMFAGRYFLRCAAQLLVNSKGAAGSSTLTLLGSDPVWPMSLGCCEVGTCIQVLYAWRKTVVLLLMLMCL